MAFPYGAPVAVLPAADRPVRPEVVLQRPGEVERAALPVAVGVRAEPSVTAPAARR